MRYPTADESSANKILRFLEYFASKGFQEFQVATSASRPGQIFERRSWKASKRDELATVAREMVRYLRHFPIELRGTFNAIS
jgi:hypothetical protein